MAGSLPPLQLRNVTRGTVVAPRVHAGDSFWSRFLGLMGRDALDPEEGLWLPGVNNIHMFFMRFAIDACFVGTPAEDGTRAVVEVREALPPWRGIVWYARGARGVVELAAGTLARSGTRVGDRVVLARPDGPPG
ncbi:MAG: DUF192 domain-containing protein [Candidatus Limnocylindrales bacterium]